MSNNFIYILIVHALNAYFEKKKTLYNFNFILHPHGQVPTTWDILAETGTDGPSPLSHYFGWTQQKVKVSYCPILCIHVKLFPHPQHWFILSGAVNGLDLDRSQMGIVQGCQGFWPKSKAGFDMDPEAGSEPTYLISAIGYPEEILYPLKRACLDK